MQTVQLVLKVNLERGEVLDSQGQKEAWVMLDDLDHRVCKVLEVLWVVLEYQEKQDLKVKGVFLAQMVGLGNKDLRAYKVHLVSEEAQENEVYKCVFYLLYIILSLLIPDSYFTTLKL